MNTSLQALLRSGRLRRVDAALGAWVARALPAATADVALATALAARAVEDGHSALDLASAQDWFERIDGTGTAPALPEPGAWQASLRDATGACRTRDGDPPAPLTLDAQGRVYLSRYFDAERRVATALAARARSETQASIPVAHGEGDGLDPQQQRAIAAALAHRFILVTGGPGSGKTFSVAHILAALAATPGTRIALAAPTGKAAARLGESLRAQFARMNLPDHVAEAVPRGAATLHRMLGISPWRERPRHHRDAPLPFDVVVVDEASMIDLPLMARLTDALATDARLILLGDPNQLSAVEAGNVLPALVEAASDHPFAACHVALTGSHRFGADSALGRLARAIVAADSDAALALLQADGDSLRLATDTTRAALIEAAYAGFRPVLDATTPAGALVAARGFRVLTARRHGPTGCDTLNREIEARLKRASGVYADAEWWRGRLVMVTANREEPGLFNGDIGVAWPDAHGNMHVWFEGADGKARALPTAAMPPNEGAFALTVHKAQGSEFDRVALVTGPDSAVLTRELLYTGVTRARSAVTLHTTPEILRTGIGRRTLRMTGLADRLREVQDPGRERA